MSDWILDRNNAYVPDVIPDSEQNGARAQDMELAPWLLIFPSVVMVVTLMSFNFIGDGLRDALDPKDR